MQQGLKQRLVGAIVILALVVIFLPMLLQGPVDRTRVDVPIQVPPEPDQPTDQTLPPPDFTERSTPGDDIIATAPGGDDATVGDPSDGADGSADATNAGEQPTVPEPEGRVVAGGGDGLASDGASGADAERDEGTDSGAEESQQTPPEGRPGSWVIQLGAFSELANAEQLSERLTEADFEDAYRDRSQVNGNVLHRVRVGPVSTRTEAEAIRERVDRELDISAILVPR